MTKFLKYLLLIIFVSFVYVALRKLCKKLLNGVEKTNCLTNCPQAERSLRFFVHVVKVNFSQLEFWQQE